MENNKWDRNEWQGRRKDQVDSTNLIVYSVMAAIVLTIILAACNYFINHI